MDTSSDKIAQNSTTISIYVIETELQFLACQEIIKITDDSCHLIFSYSESLSEKLQKRGVKHTLLDRKWSGSAQKIKKLRKCLRDITDSISKQGDFDTILFHTPRIDQVHQNFIIHALNRTFRQSQLRLRMIPDGILNSIMGSTSKASKVSIKTRIKHLKYLLFPDLRYHYFNGCSIGIDDPMFDVLYAFKGIKTNYPQNKVRSIDITIERNTNSRQNRKALVIGQRLIDLRLATPNDVRTIGNLITLEIERLDVERVYYLGHPRSSEKEFNNEYQIIEDDIFCAEELYAQTYYSYIIGCTSTALINAKMLIPNSVVISVGMSTVYKDQPEKAEMLRRTFEAAGVIVI